MDATLERPFTPATGARAGGLLDRRYGPLVPHALLVFIGFVTLWLAEEPATTLYVTGAAVCVAYPWIIFLEIRRAPLGLSPISFYFGWNIMSLGLAAIHHANKLAEGLPIRFSVQKIYPDELAAGYVMYLVGAFGLHAGLQLIRPIPEPGERPPPMGSGFLALWSLGVFMRFIGPIIDVGGFGAFSGLVQWGSLAALTGFVAHQGANHRRASFWILFTLGTVVEFIVNLRAGSKAFLMFSFLPAGILFTRQRPLRRWLPVLGIALSVFYLGVVAPVVSAARQADAVAGENQSDRIVRTYTQGDYGEGDGIEEQTAAFFDRSFEPIPASFLYGEVERHGLRWGDTFDYLAYAFVPRLFWPDKPTVSRGGWFYYYIGAARSEAEATTSVAQTAAGELYWNFGFPGALFGMGVIGALFGFLWRLTTPFPEQDPIRLVLYIALCFNMIDMAEAGTTLVNIVFRALVLVPSMLLLDRAARKRAEAAPSEARALS
ncbi:hypothetical protein [Polyangium jinanense]|uniref:Oligosaccharide repeat unit polymerase n=1 Tax=Polyangium jinanense TaxID=2829994 RepID=A0A9X3X407_9BACT|nr:hypothetical protein [Polyangium jinanense]MDC3953888.1 hypothetical protein [Polyangium jinanense]MDC3983874.1 hypothetical protein [Polyangium jinanense]